ncbi:hypothetical protein M3I53_22245 [Paraburkholderia sp. CNPSo 3272]|uniref:hypothetical protein n=1 Tax=Paraburkholderia sp. CNPSo 3272 TaxID=2940931 RepID=UPI0020B80F0A|nr:hypothetical protein [Paraburkholderia sp. CNPSo 3272]MCP3725817.1 hypothetical protein [Paraburkholderia sp. CNPSo 3272]
MQTVGDLEAALTQAETADQLVFIELVLPTMDAPALLKQFAGRLADFDYGERGPRNPLPAVAQVSESVGSARERNRVVDESA